MRHQVIRTLPYTPDQLLTLVGDVEAYPQFVPWIVGMRTWNSRTDSQGMSWTDAEAKVGFSFLKESFSTRVRRDPAGRQIDVGLISGPFKSLRNQWRFEPEGEGTRVVFDIEFEFKSKMLGALLTSNLSHAVDKLMACFEARAKALYG
ncbi:type II toxin-antitoxin system RatA family toxin [Phenylobacterium sp.]|uniref:type II toxin-antitoxin system RatA family toxin n=1 Tax=Phenylobacterium sp. TaxID=1871053 RepID=UPI002736DA32|nr:SRPBCC family protein [Phenylobacterium sp.]MDP3633070.1 SRPBCC family protein [Phenylobacterium sp.]